MLWSFTNHFYLPKKKWNGKNEIIDILSDIVDQLKYSGIKEIGDNLAVRFLDNNPFLENEGLVFDQIKKR